MIRKIEIDFPIEVNLNGEDQRILDDFVKRICDKNTPEGMVFWPAERGSKMTYLPLTQEEEKERGCEFDDDIFYIGCAIREKYENE